jgi:hypothetical protein
VIQLPDVVAPRSPHHGRRVQQLSVSQSPTNTGTDTWYPESALYTSSNSLGPSILLYRSGFLKKLGGMGKRKERARSNYVFLKLVIRWCRYKQKLGGPSGPEIDTGGGGPLEHSHACSAPLSMQPTVAPCYRYHRLADSMSVYLRTSTLAGPPLPGPPSTTPSHHHQQLLFSCTK